MMNLQRIYRRLIILGLASIGLLSITGCTNIMDEDPNSQQIPWATPADWEGQVPGMPNQGGY